MKIPSSRRMHGFTLVELLVVIAIIAVLAAAGFAAGNAAIQKAKKVTGLASAVAIESAVNSFFTEYGCMPTDQTNDLPAMKTDSGKGLELITELLGLNTAPTALNVRGVKFLSVKEGKAKKGGLIYNSTGTTISGLFDPWGGPFYAVLDCDFDEQIKPAPVGGGGATLNGRRVAVWSNGADGVKGGGKSGDDVKTW